MAYATLRDVHTYVLRKEEFKGNNIFGRRLDGNIYAVFSYRYDYPILIHAAGMWFENQDKYSRSTSRHLSVAKPYYVETRKLSVDAMNDLLNPHTQSGSVLRMLAAAQEANRVHS